MEAAGHIEALLQITKTDLTSAEKEDIINKLSVYINTLLLHDFDKLISVLYRIDVSETKLKLLLKNNPGKDASLIIATELLNRQLEKIKTRRFFSKNSPPNSDDQW